MVLTKEWALQVHRAGGLGCARCQLAPAVDLETHCGGDALASGQEGFENGAAFVLTETAQAERRKPGSAPPSRAAEPDSGPTGPTEH